LSKDTKILETRTVTIRSQILKRGEVPGTVGAKNLIIRIKRKEKDEKGVKEGISTEKELGGGSIEPKQKTEPGSLEGGGVPQHDILGRPF